MKATVLAESSFIFSMVSLRYADVYRRESGRCRTLPWYLIFFIICCSMVRANLSLWYPCFPFPCSSHILTCRSLHTKPQVVGKYSALLLAALLASVVLPANIASCNSLLIKTWTQNVQLLPINNEVSKKIYKDSLQKLSLYIRKLIGLHLHITYMKI